MKKLCLLLVICLALPWLPLHAEQPTLMDKNRQELRRYSGPLGAVTLPDTIDGVPLRRLALGLFDRKAELTEIHLPEGLNYINQNVFYFCENLHTVSLPDSLQAIDSYAFFECSSLKELTLPARLGYIGNSSFSGLRALEKLTFLGPPPLITGKDPFMLTKDAPNVQVTVPANYRAAYEALLGVSCQAGPEVQPPDITTQEDQLTFDPATGAITAYLGHDAVTAFPATIQGVAVQSLAPKALFGNPFIFYLALPEGLHTLGAASISSLQLAGISLPSSLKVMEKEALASNRLQELEIPSGVQRLEAGVLKRNGWLHTLTLPAGLQEIGPEALMDCSSLDYLVLRGNVLPAAAPDAFQNTKLEDVDIAPTATRAQEQAVKEGLEALGIHCDVWRANEPDQAPYPGRAVTHDPATGLINGYDGSVTAMASYWNFYAGDQKVDVKGIADGVFKGSQLTRFDLPRSNQFVSIGNSAFEGSALQDIRLFDSLTTIGEAAFRDCTALKQLVIPDSVTAIGAEAFKGCTGLELLVLPAAASIPLSAVAGIPQSVLRISPHATAEQQRALSEALGFPWYQGILRPGEQAALTRMPDSYTPNAEADFEFDKATGDILKYLGQSPDVIVPREIGGVKVEGIGFLAFSNLTVASVAEGTQDNQGLHSVVLPETVLRIADSAFLKCTALQTFDCYGPVKVLGNRAFENSTALTRASFHNSLRTVGPYAFHLCGQLKTLELGDKHEQIQEGGLLGCGFETIRLTSHSIGERALAQNNSLRALHIAPSVRDIGAGAFQSLPALQLVCFEGGDAGILGEFRYQFSEGLTAAIRVPTGTSDEALALFQQKLKQNMLDEGLVQRGDCTPTAPASPPAAAATEAPAAAAPPPAQGPDAAGAGQPGTDLNGRRFVCTKAEAGGYALDPATIGEYAVDFLADGNAQLTFAGSKLPPAPYKDDGQQITINYYGVPYTLVRVEGGLEFNMMDAMLMLLSPV